MSRFRISTQAGKDIEDIWNYVANNNLEAANNLFDMLRANFPKLAKFPQIGRERSQLAPELRSFPVKSYLIFYRPIETGIEIVLILHGSQDLERIFQDTSDAD